jgi:Zn-dependent protease
LDFDLQRLAHGLIFFVILLFSLSFHESAHAWAALRMGDDTAARLGRITLNPIAHIDPFGTLLLPLIQILTTGTVYLGWAKPTPYNPANFDRKHSLAKGHVRVAAAGPLSNLILALLFALALGVALRFGAERESLAVRLLLGGIFMNVTLALFNFVPLPPLDGSKVALFGLPRSFGEAYDRYVTPYGAFILLALVATGAISRVLAPVSDLIVSALLVLVAVIR